MTLRGLFRFKEGERPPVPIDEVEPVESIVKRFYDGCDESGRHQPRRCTRHSPSP